jgi:hypothetical protein
MDEGVTFDDRKKGENKKPVKIGELITGIRQKRVRAT